MNPLYEQPRFDFYLTQGDQLERGLISRIVYLHAAIDRRRRYGSKDIYRRLYLESAWSFRHLLRKVTGEK